MHPQRVCVTYMAANPVFAQASPQAQDAWRSELRPRLRLPDRFVLGVGYEPRKNIPLLIEAFSRLAQKVPDVGLVIVAAHAERGSHFRELSHELRLGDRVCVLGGMHPKDLAALYNLADVFVFPSDRESVGLPPLEAMACGVPTIAMNLTSIPEVVGDGGILLDGTSPDRWADAIERVLKDETLRRDLSIRGLRQAKSFSWRRCAEETIEVYRSVEAEIKTRHA